MLRIMMIGLNRDSILYPLEFEVIPIFPLVEGKEPAPVVLS